MSQSHIHHKTNLPVFFFYTGIFLTICALLPVSFAADQLTQPAVKAKEDGYRGIWYYNQKLDNEYVYKYSGGLGTYCAKHLPIAIYAPEANKTFFCYGGTAKEERRLFEMVSYYDHKTGMVPRPTMLMDKQTSDAHDNPVLSIDEAGYLWIFISAHGTSRPAYIYKSDKPYSIDSFHLILERNYSYPQPWYLPGRGFLFLQTLYQGKPRPGRKLFWQTSPDGITWSEPKPLAFVAQGHYQISWRYKDKVGTAFNYHPENKGLNWRTNLYYTETSDFGETWHTIQGQTLELPLEQTENIALIKNYEAEKRLVYLKDLNFDKNGNPVILYVTSGGFQSGPENDPRTWTIARWTGKEWDIRPITNSDNNYDTGCLHIEDDGTWRLIAPTGTGPQPYNTGGEIELWISHDFGVNWMRERAITSGSPYNHTYCRKPVNAHPDFYAFWADGHGRQPSESRLYFCDRTGEKVFRLPPRMTNDFERPERLDNQ